jgi:hypothetical protein
MPEIPPPRLWRNQIHDESDQTPCVTDTDRSTPAPKSSRRTHWRLRLLLFLSALMACLFLFSQLDPSTANKLGPVAQAMFDLLRPDLALEETSPSGRRLIAEVSALGGVASIMERTRPFLGLFGQTETFHVRLNQTKFGDEALATLVETPRSQISGSATSKDFPTSSNSLLAMMTSGTSHNLRRRSAPSPMPD